MSYQGQGHNRNQNVGFNTSVPLSIYQSNLSISNNVIAILASFNNLTFDVQGQMKV